MACMCHRNYQKVVAQQVIVIMGTQERIAHQEQQQQNRANESKFFGEHCINKVGALDRQVLELLGGAAIALAHPTARSDRQQALHQLIAISHRVVPGIQKRHHPHPLVFIDQNACGT